MMNYIKSGVGRPNLSKVFLIFLKDFLLWNCKSRLFHSRMVQGKNEYLKVFVRQKHGPTEYVERVSYVLFLRGINLQRYLGARCVFIS